MANMKTALIRIGNANPELRTDIRHILAHLEREKTAAGREHLLSPGQASDHPEVKDFLAQIERMYRRYLPGEIRTKAERKFGGNSINITFTLLPKSEWPRGIMNNDPSLHRIWLHDSYTEHGLNDRVKAELSQGGKVKHPQMREWLKVGWRNSTSKPSTMLKKFDRYFKKLATVASDAGYDL